MAPRCRIGRRRLVCSASFKKVPDNRAPWNAPRVYFLPIDVDTEVNPPVMLMAHRLGKPYAVRIFIIYQCRDAIHHFSALLLSELGRVFV